MKKEKRLALVALILFLLANILALVFVGRPMIKHLSDPEAFRGWIEGYGAFGRVIYVVLVFLQVVFALIPGEVFETFGGYAYGAIEGTILCCAASAAGSAAVFFLVRRYGMRFASVFFSEEKLNSLSFLKSTPSRVSLLFLIFTVPGTPKDLISYFAGFTDIKPIVWLIICTVGRVPSIITSTVGGSAIGEKNYLFAALIYAAALASGGAGLLIYRAVCGVWSARKNSTLSDNKDKGK